MAHRWWGMVLALGTLVSSSAVAQVRQVTGRVTNGETGAGVSEATIAVQGRGSWPRAGPTAAFPSTHPMAH